MVDRNSPEKAGAVSRLHTSLLVANHSLNLWDDKNLFQVKNDGLNRAKNQKIKRNDHNYFTNMVIVCIVFMF